MLRYSVAAAAVALAVASAMTPVAAQRIKAGVLSCDVSGGLGLIVASQRQVSCLYTPDLPGPQEAYVGSFRRFGLDVGVTGGAVMVWGVFTSTIAGPGFLAGDYVGASGEATVAAGLGANVLVGGSSHTVALQPVSVSGQVGLNVALGIGDLTLYPAGR
jgi:Protein of unknown function (DUF992)